jgi:hypothetical protein
MRDAWGNPAAFKPIGSMTGVLDASSGSSSDMFVEIQSLSPFLLKVGSALLRRIAQVLRLSLCV